MPFNGAAWAQQKNARAAANAALAAGRAANLSPRDAMIAAGIDPTSTAAVSAVMNEPFQNIDSNNMAAVLAAPLVSVQQATQLLSGTQTAAQKATITAHTAAAASPTAQSGIAGKIAALPTPVKVVGGIGIAGALFAIGKAIL